MNEISHREDHLPGIGRLHRFTIEKTFDLEGLRVRNFITRRYKRAQRSESIEALAAYPLAIAELQIARTDIVDARITEDVVERFGFLDLARAPAYDDGQFGFEVDLLRNRV